MYLGIISYLRCILKVSSQTLHFSLYHFAPDTLFSVHSYLSGCLIITGELLLLARCEAGLAAMADGGCGALPLVLARTDLEGEDCGRRRRSQILTELTETEQLHSKVKN